MTPDQHASNRRQTSLGKQPHKLAKYFDEEKGPMCFQCNKWGHLGKDCPEKQVLRLNSVSNDACYVTANLKGKTIRAQVDSGASISVVWSKLVPEPPKDAPTIMAMAAFGSTLTLSVVPVQFRLFDRLITVDATVFDGDTVDLLIGRNCPDFKELLYKAEGLDKIQLVTTRQETKQDAEEDHRIATEQTVEGVEATPLKDLLGKDLDFPQTKFSLQSPDPTEKTILRAIAKTPRHDPSLADLWRQAEQIESDFVIEEGALLRKTKDKDGDSYTRLVLPTNQQESVIRIAHSTPAAGHVGYESTKYKNYFWPGMSKQIKACQM